MTGTHVLHLIDGLNIGGAEVLLRDLTIGLMKRGYRVSVGYSTPGPLVQEVEALGIKLTRFPRFALVDPTLLIRMVRLMRRDPPHIVHTHLFKSDFHGRLAARIAQVPVIISTLHNKDSWARNKLLGQIYGATANFVDCLIAVSNDVSEFHLKRTYVHPEKMVTIENGVDIRPFIGKGEAGKELRKKFGISLSAPLFGIIGRLKPQKDHKTFLRSAAEIYRLRPDARFLIVGDGPLRGELEKMTKKLGLLPALHFTGMRNDIPAVLAALDVLVLSSKWEGLPVILLEGMAASRPVVSTAVGGVPHAVLPDISAFLVQPEDSLALAKACLRLANDPDLCQRMGKAGFKYVAEEYDLERMIDRIAVLYDSLLGERGLAHLSSARCGDIA
ncbi:MAG: glycosyltransferase [Anaerolineae bacterium]|nr:glycosyltransferase [Anaerolineae bacterium]